MSEVRCPTLVLHAHEDGVAPLSEGRYLAQHIPAAEFHVLDSKNHVLQPHEPAWANASEAILRFTWAGRANGGHGLTPREEAVLNEICSAKSNKEIALTLDLNEKTVRSHATHIFAKLGVSSGQEAILKMQTHD